MASITKSPMKCLDNIITSSTSPLKRAKLSNFNVDIENQRTHTKVHAAKDDNNVAPVLRFAKLTEHATAPTRGSKLAAGYDLYSAYDCVVPAKGKILIKTDIQIELPHGCYGRVAPRSGLAHKHFLDVGAGVIDEDYRGNVGVILFNFNSEDYKVTKGDRIAQLICEQIYYPEIEEVANLSETERGAGGYGSTGKS